MQNAKPADLIIPADDSPPDPTPLPVPSAGALLATELTDTTSFPNRVHGKVFFTKPASVGGGNFVCSGTAVFAANDSTVITAGHCVADSGAFATNLSFVPGYRNGSSPYGVWAASSLGSTPQWIAAENFKYDVGVAVMARNSTGQELEDVVGARGILFNQPVSGTVRSFGYPAETPFDGSKLFACDGSLGVTDPNPGLPAGGPAPMQLLCDMTGGSSGGGWVKTDASGNGSVMSVNSYKYRSQPTFMYGPQLTGVAQTLYSTLESATPGSPLSPAAGGAPQPTGTTSQAQPASGPLKAKCRKPKRRGKKKRCKKLRR